MTISPNSSGCHGYTVLTSKTVVLPNRCGPATLVICQSTGQIIQICDVVRPRLSFPPDCTYVDYQDKVLMPGLVDTHVHLNEPGRTSSEGFFTGTQAAASGGITTVIDMPLNSIPATTNVAALYTKMQAAQDKCWVDVGFLGGLIPGNKKDLKPLIRAGVRGLKGFLIGSGVPEFPQLSLRDVEEAMVDLRAEPTMLMFHAEMVPTSPSDARPLDKEKGDPFLYPSPALEPVYRYSEFLASRPPTFETTAVGELISLAKVNSPSPPIHIAHVSAAEVLPIVERAQREGVDISAETCFHYLTLTAEEVPMRDTRYKAEPPIRSATNKDKLWSSLYLEGDSQESREEKLATVSLSPLTRRPLTMVVSDHSPCAPQDKLLPSYIPPHPEPPLYHNDVVKRANGDFFRAWGGISSLGFGLSLLWTELSTLPDSDVESAPPQSENCLSDNSCRSCPATMASTLSQLAEWLSSNPARLVGLENQKGRLAVRYDGDVLVFDPHRFWTVEEADMKFRHKMSPYRGRTLRGRVVETWLRGQKIYALHGGNGGFEAGQPRGRLLVQPRGHTRRENCAGCPEAGSVCQLSATRPEEPDEEDAEGWCCAPSYWTDFLPESLGYRRIRI